MFWRSAQFRCRALFFYPDSPRTIHFNTTQALNTYTTLPLGLSPIPLKSKKILKTEKQYTPKPYNTIRNTTMEKTKIFKKSKKSLPDTPGNGTDTTHSSVRLQNLHTDNPGDTFALQSGGTRTPEVC